MTKSATHKIQIASPAACIFFNIYDNRVKIVRRWNEGNRTRYHKTWVSLSEAREIYATYKKKAV